MSSQRRACYKCGNVGHYAEVCSSSERLCYNCKQPGHESSGCPHPRTTETKQCYHCQGLGHVQADCPTLRISGVGTGNGRCYSCGQIGHLARACMNNTTNFQGAPSAPMGRGAFAPRGNFGGAGGFRGGYQGGAAAAAGGGGPFGGGGRPATCYKCGGPNHFARDCQAVAIKCYACGKLGHISRDCPAPNGGNLNQAGKVCYKCGVAGHISRDCTAEVPNGGMGIDGSGVDAAVAPPTAPAAASTAVA